MKKTYIVIIFLALILLIWFFVDKSNKVEAPSMTDVGLKNENTEIPLVSNSMPLPSTSTEVEEKVVQKEFTVSGQNFSFVPNSITVKKGDRVKIIFKNTQGFHDFVIDEYGVATSQFKSPGEEILEFTADKTGTFQYYCSVGSHRSMGMFGTLKVE